MNDNLSLFIHHIIALYYVGGLLCFSFYKLIPSQYVLHGKTVLDASKLHIPKSNFIYFYAIGITSCISLLKFNHRLDWFILGHLIRRFLESIIYPYSKESKMHLIHGLVGITFYPIMVGAISLSNPPQNQISLIGEKLFLLGNLFQVYFHYLIQKFKSSSGYQPLRKCHFIFRITLTPHYQAEMLIYLGAWLMSGLDCLVFLNFIFVMANLFISSNETKRWYDKTFS